MPSPTYTVKTQEFLGAVVNKIGKQIYSTTAYTNPLKRLKKGFIENASDIEEIYIARAVGTNYDPNGSGALDRVKPSLTVQYHQEEYSKDFQVTVQDKQVRKGFTTTAGVRKLADEIIQSMHTGSEYEEYLKAMELLKTIGTASKYKKQVTDVTDNATAKAFTKIVKKDVKKMGLRSTTYSTVENHTKKENLILFLNMDWAVEIDVELLATAFNMSKQDIEECTIIEIDNIPGTTIKALLCDERALQIYDTFYEVEPQRNAKGKFTNHFLSTEKIFAYSNLVPIAVYQTGAIS